jgi:thiamine kinase-like enzyme
VEVAPLAGGMTNRNYLVTHAGGRFVVRLGRDLPAHGMMCFNQLAAARAAFSAGISPEVVFARPGVMVSRFVEGRTLEAQDLRDTGRHEAVVDLLRRCHRDIAQHLRGPALMFWVFQVIRGYGVWLREMRNHLLHTQLPALLAMAEQLEPVVGPVDIVFGHNDLLASNFLDDGRRLWLIDWDYAGFNSPLFDLANLSANNGFSPDMDLALLTLYFECEPDDARLRSFGAMKCASALREVLWGAVSHHSSSLPFDYAAYTAIWLERLDPLWRDYLHMKQ